MSGSENLGRKTLDDLQAFGSQTGAPGRQMLSAAEMMAAAGDLAASLRARVCAPDEPIALFIANEPRDLAGFLGIWLAGCVAAPIHVATPATAAQALVGRLGSRFAIRAGRLSVRAAPPPARPLLAGGALIVFTSGSTGRPKGVVLGHEGLSWKLDSSRVCFRSRDTIPSPCRCSSPSFSASGSVCSVCGPARVFS